MVTYITNLARQNVVSSLWIMIVRSSSNHLQHSTY
jgi:hypothetical protein